MNPKHSNNKIGCGKYFNLFSKTSGSWSNINPFLRQCSISICPENVWKANNRGFLTFHRIKNGKGLLWELFRNLKKKTLGPRFIYGVQQSQCYRATKKRHVQKSWFSFDQPWKDERLSRPGCHPVVLNSVSLKI